MPVFRLDDEIVFPPPDLADDNGLLAVGGDLDPERLLLAYSLGIFPWYHDGLPILWHSPDPRMILEPRSLHVGRSLQKELRRQRFEVRLDSAFEEVIDACASVPRPEQEGTWITAEMKQAYCELYEIGFAHCAEAWLDGELVGGLYGVSLGSVFFGESMFARADNASKVAFVIFLRQVQSWGIDLIDCQVHTELLEGFGAELWPRRRYLAALTAALDRPTLRGRWHLDAGVPGLES